MRGFFTFLILLTATYLLPRATYPQSPPSPPINVKAFDSPNDAGQSITITWEKSPDDERIDGYEVLRSNTEEGDFERIGFVAKGFFTFENNRGVEPGIVYYYKIRSISGVLGNSDFSIPSNSVFARSHIFHTGRINVLIATALFIFLLLFFVNSAKKGKSLFIRKIAGLDAIDEAVGRATEMGRPVLYVPGTSSMADVAIIASMNILGPVAKKVAEYDTPIYVPNSDPIVTMVSKEVVKGAYSEAGRPDAYNDDTVFFVTQQQFAYTAAIDGIMVREKPATNLFLGMFHAEALILAETGSMTGAIQIAGTDAVAQLPFFVTACDYTIIGEELYAASAYLSREPVLMGSIKSQDWTKMILLVFLVAGTVLGLMQINFIINLFNI
jgi:hypothetical protein